MVEILEKIKKEVESWFDTKLGLPSEKVMTEFVQFVTNKVKGENSNEWKLYLNAFFFMDGIPQFPTVDEVVNEIEFKNPGVYNYCNIVVERENLPTDVEFGVEDEVGDMLEILVFHNLLPFEF